MGGLVWVYRVCDVDSVPLWHWVKYVADVVASECHV